jgi:CTP:molybdopterin cytidylyltransferase MocA
VGLVLAAGASRRMGEPKLLLPWRGGATLLDGTLAALREGGVKRQLVVVAAGGVLAGWTPPPGVERVVNPRPGEGMLSSVQAGWSRLAGDPGADPVVVCPADLPELQGATVAALLAAQRQHGGLVVPTCGGRRGHPLLLPRRWAERIPTLDPGVGLRQLLSLAAADLLLVATDDRGVVEDVDTPADYERLRRR